MAARSGIPVAKILTEQEQRLISGTTREHQEPRQQVSKVAPLAIPDGAESNGRHPATEQQLVLQENGVHPEPSKAKTNPTLRTLDEQQKAFLAFLIANPDVPIATLSKGLGVRAETGAKIRDSLKAQGLLVEMEVRTGTTGGRPMKVLIPTLTAFELSGTEPPTGRGGMIHRHVQQMITAGATAKGYTAKCEKALGTGAIVDVHLEKPGESIAVEIAVVSHPSRELSHIRQCLNAGYDRVFTVFADPQLLARTSEALGVVFSDAEQSRIQLLPISNLPLVAT